MELLALQASMNKPRVHGNGFIQLDLPDGKRLHVWDDNIPHQTVNTAKHDHVFGFKSKVICGKLFNYVYDIVNDDNGEYDVYEPQRREGTEDTKLVETGQRVSTVLERVDIFSAGESYTFKPLIFHETGYEGTTATILEKTFSIRTEPRILVPHGYEPDNEFDRESFDPDILWPIIERALDLARAMEELPPKSEWSIGF